MPKKLVHFVGIGGIGMSALARWFLAQKWAVSGSDASDGEIVQELQKEGAKIKIGHKKTNISPNTALIIYSQAIRKNNPELREGLRRGIEMESYPEMIGDLTQRYKTIAIAGAHGKSTTTALVSLMLIQAGLDPTVIVGTKLRELRGKNFRCGRGPWFVLEADEYKESFRYYSPTAAIITNIDREHLDYYRDLRRIKKAFLRFTENIREGGTLVVNQDDKNLWSMRPALQRIAMRKKVQVRWHSLVEGNKRLISRLSRAVKIAGRHNLSNVLAAYTLARSLGISEETILKAVGQYRGAWRRMEYRGTLRLLVRGKEFLVPVFDDYAHHPTEIRATLAAFRERYPERRIICVFQPHQAERLRLLFKDFITAFTDADALILLPTYRVRGRDKQISTFTAHALGSAIAEKKTSLAVTYLPYPQRLSAAIARALEGNKKSILIMMGAGDIVSYTNRLLEKNYRT